MMHFQIIESWVLIIFNAKGFVEGNQRIDFIGLAAQLFVVFVDVVVVMFIFPHFITGRRS